jgi:HEAT repeat protein
MISKIRVFSMSFFAIAVLLAFGQSKAMQGRGFAGLRCSSDIQAAVQDLASSDESQRQRARQSLDHYATKSAACRNAIVHGLMAAMDKPNLDLNSDESTYNIWKEGADFLGGLRATEALDLLISHLDLTHGVSTSFSLNYQPAIGGVLSIGRPAIPKLSYALRHNSNPRIRAAAAFCLSNIEGRSANLALRQAMHSETDQCIVAFLRLAVDLDNLETKAARKRLTPAEKNALEHAQIGRMSALTCR